MAYKCLFMDNDIYTAQDVNDAISNIVSDGVCGYPFGNNALADLNSAMAELANNGVDYRGTACRVVKVGGIYKISEGACIMNDGSQIIFDSSGYEIEVTTGVLQYVYLERDVLHNRINVVVSQTAGGEGTVPLAEIAANGAISDKRRFATAKVSLLAEPHNIGVTKRLRLAEITANNVVDFGFSGWKYIIFQRGSEVAAIKMDEGETIYAMPRNNNNTNYVDVLVTRRGSSIIFNQLPGVMDVEVEVR